VGRVGRVVGRRANPIGKITKQSGQFLSKCRHCKRYGKQSDTSGKYAV